MLLKSHIHAKKIDKAQKALEELFPKLNAYHLKTQKEIKAAVDQQFSVNEIFSPKYNG
jgi:hypothetical protein